LVCDKAEIFVLVNSENNTKTVSMNIYDEYLKDIGGIIHFA
jgi:hypothetical protein